MITSLSASFVICAYRVDRIPYAMDAVQSSLALTLQPLEVLVVADKVSGLWNQLRAQLPVGIAMLENEGGRGLSHARNTGARAARGDLVVFLDDDAVAHPDWLHFISMAFADPKVMAAGGRALPMWVGASARPYWLPEELDWLVGCTYKGFAEGVRSVRNVHGSNMCFRRTAFDLVGGFDPLLGGPVFGDDTEICIRIVTHPEGYRVLYDPRAIVFHKVAPDRQRWRYCIRHAFEAGVGKEVIRVLHGRSTTALSAERSFLRQVLTTFLPAKLGGVLKVNLRDAAQLATMLAVTGAVALGHVWFSLARHLFPDTLSYRGHQLGRYRMTLAGDPPVQR